MGKAATAKEATAKEATAKEAAAAKEATDGPFPEALLLPEAPGAGSAHGGVPAQSWR